MRMTGNASAEPDARNHRDSRVHHPHFGVGHGGGGWGNTHNLRIVKLVVTAEEYRWMEKAYEGDLIQAMDNAGYAVAQAAVRVGAGYAARSRLVVPSEAAPFAEALRADPHG